MEKDYLAILEEAIDKGVTLGSEMTDVMLKFATVQQLVRIADALEKPSVTPIVTVNSAKSEEELAAQIERAVKQATSVLNRIGQNPTGEDAV